jgi:archaellum component FlaC
MLQKQVDNLKKVILDMESDINKFQSTVKSLAKEYNVKY